MKKFFFLTFLACSIAGAAEDWFCKEVASQRSGNLVKSCGVGTGIDENAARSSAFENAKQEFGRLCTISADCRGRAVTVSPERTSCEKEEKNYKCYRMLVFAIGDPVKDNSPEWNGTTNPAAMGTEAPLGPVAKATEAAPRFEPVFLEQKETFKPFYYRDIASLPKITVGMAKKKALAKFGRPASVRELEDSVQVFYRDKSFCEGPRCSFKFDSKSGKVTAISDFRYEFTESLK